MNLWGTWFAATISMMVGIVMTVGYLWWNMSRRVLEAPAWRFVRVATIIAFIAGMVVGVAIFAAGIQLGARSEPRPPEWMQEPAPRPRPPAQHTT